MIVIKMRMVITHACPGQLDNKIQVCLHSCHKMPCSVLVSLHTSSLTVWLGIWLNSIKDTFCGIYIHRKTF